MSNIFQASKTGNIRRVKELIQKPFFGFFSRCDINITDAYGRTPLLHATENNQYETVKFLLQNNADVNIQENTVKFSPLLAAAEYNYVDITQELLKNKALVNIRTAKGKTPLWRASFVGHLETVKLLLQYKADVNLGCNDNFTPLYVSCLNGYLHVASLLLENGADVHITATANNITPLFISCQEGHTDIVRLLLQNGADVNITAFDNITPLYICCQNGHTDVLQHLLDHNADPTVGRDSTFPLSTSSFYGHNDAVILLLQHQVEVDIRDDKQCTPLILASQEGHVNVVKTLLSYGAMVNAASHKGATALHMASTKGHRDMLDILLTNGASLECRDIYHNTALMYAACYNHLDCIMLLQSRGADINASNNDNITALYLATLEGNIDIIKFLINNNVEITKDKFGNTPIDVAEEKNFDDIKYLLQCYQNGNPGRSNISSKSTGDKSDQQPMETTISKGKIKTKLHHDLHPMSQQTQYSITGIDKNASNVIEKGSILQMGQFEKQVTEVIAKMADLEVKDDSTIRLEGATAAPDIDNILAKISNIGYQPKPLTELTDDYLLRISSKVKDDWSLFGGFLGLPLTLINEMEEKYGKNLACWNMLVKWRDNTQGTDEVKKQRLKEAAVLIDRRDVYNLIK